MLTLKAVGQRLGEVRGREAFSLSAVTRYVQQGLLRGQRLGNLWVVEETELERFLREDFPTLGYKGGRPRKKLEAAEGRKPHGNAGKKYRKRKGMKDEGTEGS